MAYCATLQPPKHLKCFLMTWKLQ